MANLSFPNWFLFDLLKVEISVPLSPYLWSVKETWNYRTKLLIITVLQTLLKLSLAINTFSIFIFLLLNLLTSDNLEAIWMFCAIQGNVFIWTSSFENPIYAYFTQLLGAIWAISKHIFIISFSLCYSCFLSKYLK